MESAPPPGRRRFFLGALAVLAALGVVLGVVGGYPSGTSVAEAKVSNNSPKNDDQKDDPISKDEAALVAVEGVERGAIAAYVTAAANLVPEDEVQVVAEAEGKVVALKVEEGDRVARGQALVQIDTRDAALAVEKAELGLRNGSLNLERAERMAAESLISAEELDKFRYERDVAQHGLDEARNALRKTTVAAPFAGRITRRHVQPGQTVKPGQELLTLADFEPLVARIFLPEREVFGLRPGQEARFTLKASQDVRFKGRIQRISPVVDVASGTVKVTVEAVSPPANVRPGAFVTVGIVREKHLDALLIPRAAVVRELQEAYVYVADNGVARKRTVRLGIEEGQRLEVLEGLEAGEAVITSGQGNLRDESHVRLADTDTDTDTKS